MMNSRNILVVVLFALIGAYIYPQSAQRIVSLAPSLTTMIYLLDARNKLVGCTSYCEEALRDNKNVVASAMEVNVEKVFLLKPDLVVTTTLTKPATIEALEKLGINVKVLPTPRSYDEICSQLIEIAKPIGEEPMARSIIEKQKARLNFLMKQIPNGKKPKVFFEIGDNPLYTVIPNTFMDDYITFSGGENIASDLKIGTITRENVLLKNPDVIVIVTMGVLGIKEKTTWENYHNMNASKNGRIFIVDSNKACSSNPVTFVDVVEQLIKVMY